MGPKAHPREYSFLEKPVVIDLLLCGHIRCNLLWCAVLAAGRGNQRHEHCNRESQKSLYHCFCLPLHKPGFWRSASP